MQRRDTQIDIEQVVNFSEQVKVMAEELYLRTRDLFVELENEKVKIERNNLEYEKKLAQAYQQIDSLTHQNQRLRNILKKRGIDVSNKL